MEMNASHSHTKQAGISSKSRDARRRPVLSDSAVASYFLRRVVRGCLPSFFGPSSTSSPSQN